MRDSRYHHSLFEHHALSMIHEYPCSPWLIYRCGIIAHVFKHGSNSTPLNKIETFLYIPIILRYFCYTQVRANTSHYATAWVLSGQCQTHPRCLLTKIETANLSAKTNDIHFCIIMMHETSIFALLVCLLFAFSTLGDAIKGATSISSKKENCR